MIIKKEDIIAALAAHSDVTKKEAKDSVEFLMEYIADTLSKGNAIELYNYATLEVVETAARNGINPATKERIVIPAKKKIKFTAKKGLKDRI